MQYRRYLSDTYANSETRRGVQEPVIEAFRAVGKHVQSLEQRIEALEKEKSLAERGR